ncbi:DEAD/DEAH box helicase [Paenibacillus larvae]|uniref:RNA polymerase-associated helicase-like protein n=1 Tax=Paenibacillus larvae subsp. larvae TaxID=147375 RepID=A0A2L1U7F6_9BACL|nr:DEAD/DEAH box helicase [Paenibacillus larvae]AVF28867.1 RNA polymerase-associated helicase-like protein [Paenibacillus larvae subsp. larvae]MCY9502428.1 DEAD/DEAH box helicase [Paenibacillus larvae]MDR5608762.1 DEAD/DEAH box helicase [Paenibacillus larvae]
MTILRTKTELYEHQEKAFHKLSIIKVGALYMEMGTGKTRTALELCAKRINAGKVSKVLWLCPCSVKDTIVQEIDKHVEGCLSLFEICGIETLSSSIKTNVQLLRLVQSESTFLIVDESNLVKNHKAIRTKNITRLAEFCTYKLILNGTPISRNEADLYAQWKILDWRILGYKSFWSFSRNHINWDERIPGKIRSMKNTRHLVERIAPYTYQVRKSECITLPPKTYKTVYYSLTAQQYEHYNAVADELFFQLDELEPHTIYRLFTGMQNVISGFRVKVGKKLEKTYFFQNPLDNPRVQTLFSLIEQIGEEKIIVFCKYTREIHEITTLLNAKYGVGSAVPFNGEVTQKKRQAHKKAFTQNARFLVANKTCAGYGLNLQFCSYAIFYNNDWDYATRGQAEDRIHRIGQNQNVHILDICARGTLDHRILTCLSRKEDLVESFKHYVENMKDRKDLSLLARAWVEGGKKVGESI